MSRVVSNDVFYRLENGDVERRTCFNDFRLVPVHLDVRFDSVKVLLELLDSILNVLADFACLLEGLNC